MLFFFKNKVVHKRLLLTTERNNKYQKILIKTISVSPRKIYV